MALNKKDTIVVAIAALVINMVLFMSIPLLSEMEDMEQTTEYATPPTVVNYHKEKRRQEQEEQKPKEKQEEEAPKTLPQEPPQPKPKSVSRPGTDLHIRQPEFELSKLEIVTAEVEPVRQEPKPAPQQNIGTARDTFSLGEVDQRPRVISKVNPVYPFWARQREITGSVVLKFLVNKSGSVSKVSVVKAEPPGVFEQSAQEAVKKWQFEPGYFEGKPVNTWVTVPIRFTMSK